MKADKTSVNKLLKTAKGQIEGILKMVEEDRYCMDIAAQILAAEAVLKKANNEILTSHLKSCVLEAYDKGDLESKIEELIVLFKKRP